MKEHIGAGSYGHVYKVVRNSDQQLFAAKIELDGEHNKLSNEYELLSKMQEGSSCFCKMIELSIHVNTKGQKFNVMVMELLGSSLDRVFDDLNENKFEAKVLHNKVFQIGQQMVKALQELHSYGIIHRDIKPHNFCLSNETTHGHKKVYLIDFGLSKYYLQDGCHIKI